MSQAIVIFIKAPEPGKVKTRLCPPLSPEQAAQLYISLAQDTWNSANRVSGVEVLAAYEPGDTANNLHWLAAGNPVSHFRQKGRDLGERLIHAFETAFHKGARKVIVIGSDAPLLSREIMEQAFFDLDRNELILGPAKDGGYYLMGLKKPELDLFRDIPWSTDKVFEETMRRAEKLKLKTGLLPKLSDIDVFSDILNLTQEIKSRPSGLCPNTRHLLRSLLKNALC